MHNNIEIKNIFKKTALVSGISVLLLLIGMVLGPVNQFASGAILVGGAAFLYFFIVYKISEKNYLSFTALFTAVWIATIGLSQLRFLEYQKVWENRTWLNLILATVFFQIGIPLGHLLGNKILKLIGTRKSIKAGRLFFEVKKQRLFWICLISTIIAVGLFSWNIAVKGYVPFFSTMFNAYAFFYTKRMIFVTAAVAVSPIAYWCIKKCELSLWKKICMYLCIAINTFIIPILQVNRGVFVVAALMLTASVVYLNGGKFLVLVLCLIVTFGFYEVGSIARNYTNEYLISVFEPSQFSSSVDSTSSEGNNAENSENQGSDSSGENESGDTVSSENQGSDSDSSGENESDNTVSSENQDNATNSSEKVFQLPAKLSFLYGYFTVSHDNFNEAVINAKEYTLGIRQLAPFNVILRSGKIDEALGSAEFYMVKPSLNTANLINGAYYDLREFGVIIFVLLWAVILGAIEKIYLKNKGVFALAALGNALTPVVLCFFSSWFANFTLWMLWGTILLVMFFASVNVSSKEKS